MKYNLKTIKQQYDNGSAMSFVFFWEGIKKHGRIDSSCLSQWYPSKFMGNDVTYSSAEQYMMAQKALLFNDELVYAGIMAARHPGECKSLGRLIRNFSSELWDKNKYDIVLSGSLMKFSQNPKCLAYLLNTGDAILAEASPYDCIWGIGLSEDDQRIRNPRQWRGENLLGFALMEARDILRNVMQKR